MVRLGDLHKNFRETFFCCLSINKIYLYGLGGVMYARTRVCSRNRLQQGQFVVFKTIHFYKFDIITLGTRIIPLIIKAVKNGFETPKSLTRAVVRIILWCLSSTDFPLCPTVGHTFCPSRVVRSIQLYQIRLLLYLYYLLTNEWHNFQSLL